MDGVNSEGEGDAQAIDDDTVRSGCVCECFAICLNVNDHHALLAVNGQPYSSACVFVCVGVIYI